DCLPSKNEPLPKKPSAFRGLPMGTHQASSNTHLPQMPATPRSSELDDINGLTFSREVLYHLNHSSSPQTVFFGKGYAFI
uniref:Uncharacterized protein n=1 Tax=Castor canadensis TaxID=51338 RepID=A0A8C0XFQ4_CASCN